MELRKITCHACFITLLLAGTTACSGSKTTTTTTTTRDSGYTEVSPDGTRVIEREPETTTVEVEKTEEKESERHGLFGIIIDIIVLPFRAVGALFSAIF